MGDSSGNVSQGREIKDLLIGDMKKDAHAVAGAAVFHLLRGKDMHMLLLHFRGQDAALMLSDSPARV